MDERYEDIVDRCIQQLLAGASPDALADAYPEHRADLLAVLAPLASLAAAPVEPPASDARTAALHRMLVGVDAASSPAPRRFLSGALSSFSARPVPLRLASGGAAVLLFVGASIGASAATGHGPAFGWPIIDGSGTGAVDTQVQGAFLSSSDNSLVIKLREGSVVDVRTNLQTTFSRDGEPINRDDLQPGDVVQVHGRKGRDHVVVARNVDAEPSRKDHGASPGATPGGNNGRSDDDEGDHPTTGTPERDRSHEGPGGGDPTSTEHEGEGTPRPAEATSVSSGHGSPSGTPTATPHSGGGATSTPRSGGDSETKTPEPGD